MIYLHLTVLACECVLAGLFAHRAMPSVLVSGKMAAIKMLMLAVTLGFAAIGQLTIILEGEAYRKVMVIGHFALIGYAGLSWLQLRRDGLNDWFHEANPSHQSDAQVQEKPE